MPLTAHEVSVGVFLRGLASLKALLRKGEAHASAQAMDPAELIDARLAQDMYALAAQVHWAAEGAKLAVGRLLGADAPPFAAEARSFAEIHEKIDATVAYLSTLDAHDLEAGLARTIELTHRGGSLTFTGSQFLLQFAIPNFFFHVTTAYGILRQKGVPVTKSDFTGMAFG